MMSRPWRSRVQPLPSPVRSRTTRTWPLVSQRSSRLPATSTHVTEPAACHSGPSVRPQPVVSRVGSVESRMLDRCSGIGPLLGCKCAGGSIIAGYQRPCIGANTTWLPDATAGGYRLLPRRLPRCLPHGAADIRGQRRPQRGSPGLPRHGGSLPLISQSARKRCAASPGEAALLARALRPGIRQRGQAARGVVQSRAWMVRGSVRGVGCAKPASGALSSQACVTGLCPSALRYRGYRKRRRLSRTRADAIGWLRTPL
jgi:hypothetical protein